MKYLALNKASIKVAKDVYRIIEAYNISNKALFTVKHMAGLEEYGFMGVLVLFNKIPLASVTIDIYNNNINNPKQAIQYMSLRINKLIEEYADI